jgi:lariat debranching enzyme
MGDYHEYYSGQRLAPYLTIFCGGNHEASNHLFELYYGGWIAHNIYYLGAANVVRFRGLRISGMSGIWKGYDYRKTHYERIPYRPEDLHSVFHVRELDIRKLLQIRTQIDICLSHDWPRLVENFGDFKRLFRKKKDFEEDSKHGKLGNPAAREVMDRLRPFYWFAAHLHVEFAATVPHDNVKTKAIEPSKGMPAVWAVEVASPVAAPIAAPVAAPVALPAPKPSAAVGVSSENSRPVASGGPAPNPMIAAYENKSLSFLNNEADRLAAWGTFQEDDIKVREQQFAEASQHMSDERRSSNVDVTWKHMASGKSAGQQDSLVYANKRVKNDDEIDLDSEDDSPREDKACKPTSFETDGQSAIEATTTATRNICLESGADGADDWAPSSQDPKMSLVDQAVSDSLRTKLPAAFARPPAKAARQPMSHPAAIHNKLTKFLALDKPNNHDPFFKLLSIPVSNRENVNVSEPDRLQYDKEWLAITRVFAGDLVLGDKNAKVPDDLGEDEYLPLIQKEEEWVEENLVKKGLMNIPYNFTRSAPRSTPAGDIQHPAMPMEFPNLQTAEFCELLQIENKFFLNDEQRIINYQSVPTKQMANADDERQRGTGRRGGHRGRGHRGRGHRGHHRGSGRGTN